MAVTIKDVAKLADVAPSTVSRVIANSPRISEKTKGKVREAMEELGYHPNFIARSLASQSTQTIGLLMPSSTAIDFQNPFFATVLRGLSEGAHEKQYALHMTTGKTEEEILDGVIQMVQGGRVDGVVLLYSKIEDKILSYLQSRDFPFILIGKPFKGTEEITHVDNDNFLASKDAADHLISLGHSRIGFVGGNKNMMVTVERLLGYEKALYSAGIKHVNEYIIHEEILSEGGKESLHRSIKDLIELEFPPTALIVADDLMALGIMNFLDSLGLSVPKDISIVSFNNIVLAEMARPPLTSVDINIFNLGYEAAKNLILKIENPIEPIKRIIIPHQLIHRSSCSKINSQTPILI